MQIKDVVTIKYNLSFLQVLHLCSISRFGVRNFQPKPTVIFKVILCRVLTLIFERASKLRALKLWGETRQKITFDRTVGWSWYFGTLLRIYITKGSESLSPNRKCYPKLSYVTGFSPKLAQEWVTKRDPILTTCQPYPGYGSVSTTAARNGELA